VSTASVKALPHLDGVEFRGFRGASDYPHLARIITAWAAGFGDDRVETPEGIASGYENLERCDPFQDVVVVEVEGAVVAYSRVWWNEEAGGPHLYEHACFVDPEFAGRGIGRALFAWNEHRLREIASGHEVDKQLFEVWANDRNLAATALIRGADYEPITYSADMVRPSVDDLPDHQLPDGLEIRPVREEDVRTIWEADVEAFRDHWGFVEHTEADYQRFLAYPYLDTTLWKIAWDDEGVAGQVKSFIDTAQERGVRAQARLHRGDVDGAALAAQGRREGTHRRVDPRARLARDDRDRARSPHGESERRLRPLLRPWLRGGEDLDDVP
jgi:mycothiol synthase